MSPEMSSDAARAARPVAPEVPGLGGEPAPALVPADACPFLIAASGAYRMSAPDREHRCAAFVPATSLALSKQARLCLTANHPGCATYVASTSARQARVGAGERIERSGRWGLARTTPVVEEVGGLRATLGALLSDRRTWPAIPAVLLATLLLALGLSGSWSQSAVTAIATPTPSGTPHRTQSPSAAVATSTPSAPTSPIPTVQPTAVPTPAPSGPPGPSATPAVAYTTYTVRSGDTLYVIAQKFHTTVKAIQQLNGLSGTNLHIGQVLKIPTA